jgi:hypothetical protein
MAHFAEINDQNVVIRVIVADDKQWCENNLGGTWVQTSYNTHANKHPEGRPLHKNFAGIGYIWDGIGFYQPQPFPSWTLDQETYLWTAPKPRPNDDGFYEWSEEQGEWINAETL